MVLGYSDNCQIETDHNRERKQNCHQKIDDCSGVTPKKQFNWTNLTCKLEWQVFLSNLFKWLKNIAVRSISLGDCSFQIESVMISNSDSHNFMVWIQSDSKSDVENQILIKRGYQLSIFDQFVPVFN